MHVFIKTEDKKIFRHWSWHWPFEQTDPRRHHIGTEKYSQTVQTRDSQTWIFRRFLCHHL